MKTALSCVIAISMCVGVRAYGQCAHQSAVAVRDSVSAKGPFEDEIEQFEASDKINPPREGGVLFVGSSSIRLWHELQADFPGVNIVQRGFGGSELWQAVNYAPRIVLPYCPRRIVLYEGDNDLANGRSPEQILADYQHFVALVRASLPHTKIAFMAIKPSESRRTLIGSMRRTNELVRTYSSNHPNLIYIDTFTPLLSSDGTPRADLFEADSLHLNARGYAVWRKVIAPFVYGR